jgi:hypothetical protein
MLQLEFNDTSLSLKIKQGQPDMNDDVLFPLYSLLGQMQQPDDQNAIGQSKRHRTNEMSLLSLFAHADHCTKSISQ